MCTSVQSVRQSGTIAVALVLCASNIQLSVFALLTALISGVSPGHPTPPHDSNPVSQI